VSPATSRIAQLVAAAVVGGLVTGGGFALATDSGKSIHACVDTKTHVLTVQAKCPRGTKRLIWNVQGPPGVQGLRGLAGATGATGPAGEVPWTIDWGEVRGSPASGSGPAGCTAAGMGLTGCKYLAAGQYQVTASGCKLPVGSSNLLFQATPETGALFQSDPDLFVHAEISELGAVTPQGTVTFAVALLGDGGGSAATNPVPVDGSVQVSVYC